MREIDKIVIHCSDSPDSLDIGVREIRDWHKQRGWSDIGYHYVIRRNGTVESGRPFEIKGAHVRGHNEGSIGICWIGRDDIDDKQLVTLKKLVLAFTSKYKLDVTEDVYGHYELDSGKTCPNLDMIKFRAELIFDV